MADQCFSIDEVYSVKLIPYFTKRLDQITRGFYKMIRIALKTVIVMNTVKYTILHSLFIHPKKSGFN